MRRKNFLIAMVVLMATLLCGSVGTAAGAVAPHWFMLTRTAPTNLTPGAKAQVVAVLVNMGDTPIVGTEANPVKITETLPTGLHATEQMTATPGRGNNNDKKRQLPLSKCTALPVLQCSYVGTLPPYISIEVDIPVTVDAGASSGEPLGVKAEGGNAPTREIIRPIKIDPSPTPFGIEQFELVPEEEDGSIASQAGSHPFQLTTMIALNQTTDTDPKLEVGNKGGPAQEFPATPALLRNLVTTLPPGLLANASSNVIPRCSEVAFNVIRSGNSNECPPETAVGIAVVTFKERENFARYTATVPVFNLRPAEGEPARFGFVFEKVPIVLDTSIKTGGGYAAQVSVRDNSQAAEALSTVVTVWGVPGDPRHQGARGWECLGGGYYVQGLEPVPPCPAASPTDPPYLTLPTTTCGTPLVGSVQAQSWKNEELVPAGGLGLSNIVALQGCEHLPFNPSFSAQPDETRASTPTGLNVEVNMPQSTTLSTTGVAEADIKSTTVKLPEGMLANAGAADGLEPCTVLRSGLLSASGPANDADTGSALQGETEGQLFTPLAATCLDAAKVGTVNIKSPLLDNELKGSVYFGSQNTDPFGSPLVLYLVAEDKETGVRVKLAGQVLIDQTTGQLTSRFANTPPLPFETLKLHLTNGPRATQTTPPFCNRTYTTTAQFEPTSGQPTQERRADFSLSPNADGEPCPSQGPLPFAPSFEAGVSNPQAGAFSPFTLTIRRPDGDQPLQSISTTLPPGAAAVIASVTPCPDELAARDQCGPDSLVGHSTAVSGLGSVPVSLSGDVYLTAGYKGAPFGLLAVTHAIAGKLNLGDVPVRSAIRINPYTAAVTVTSDPLPQFVKGAPSQIKALNVTIDRPGFEFNPTNCSSMAVTGTLSGYEGASQSVSHPFGVSNCASLPFAPKLTASAGGHGSKAGGTGFNVTVTSAGLGQAGIAKVFLTIPKILPSRLTTIQKACIDKVFEANSASCPEGSNIGMATIHTPVFKNPLTGPAYLVSHGNAAFPDVEFVLQGEGVEIILDGKTDIKKGVTYSRFESSPDAPFTSFETKLPAGPHSALTINTQEGPNYNICSKKVGMPTVITGQNGVVRSTTTNVAIAGCGAVKGFKATRAQKLTKALKACRKQFKHNKQKRASCEAKARKKYGAKKAKKSKKKK
ncbi:MAG TPA: hypothetical protein VMB05_02130 [Solirubrobacteraceae bacterium]|nr:hypothetical protein [Solirubrobacteraceae bacterium]